MGSAFCRFFTDNVTTHFTSSFVAVSHASPLTTDKKNGVNRKGVSAPTIHALQGFVATGVTQPVDVLKTRLMNARSGEYKVASQLLYRSALLGSRHGH